jgi:L-fucose mutarotase
VLLGIDPLLTGELLTALDAMGHRDAIWIADAHLAAGRIADRLLTPVGTPELRCTVVSVLPLEDDPASGLRTFGNVILRKGVVQ